MPTRSAPPSSVPVPPAAGAARRRETAIAASGEGPSAGVPRPLAERDAAGRAFRDRLPRSRHGKWKRPSDRPDPIDILRASDADRLAELVPIRYGRMLASPFAFYRGTAGVMAADLAKTPTTGHKVQVCGDCHLMNFGGFATPERNVIFDINDFDETLPAPWEWDVKRLVASFVLAARSIGLSDGKGRAAAETCARSYRERLRRFAASPPLSVWYARLTSEDLIAGLPRSARGPVRARVDKALKRPGSEMDFPKLAGAAGGRAAIREAPPLIFHPEGSRAPEFAEVLDRVFGAYRGTLPDDRRGLLDRYRVVDAAIKVVGIGSVGRRCWIALLVSASGDPLFLQFKEAVGSVLEPHAGKSPYPHHGERVVMGQRLLQPASDLFLGWVTAPTGKHFYVRQLRDAKIKPLVEAFDGDLLGLYAGACGAVLARAHAKAGEVSEIGGYLGTGGQFDDALGAFALAYADQAERDYAALKAAVRNGRVDAHRDV